jgi:quinolinate synthase
MPTIDDAANAALMEEIRSLKEKRGALLLAHNYMRAEVQEAADFVGDSLELARRARDAEEGLIVFSGVRFMAETAKILSPAKTVLLPRADSGCFMADMVTAEDVRALKARWPKASVVAYVNSSAAVKAEVDACCTSANAVAVVKAMPSDEIIFVPDRNLGAWCQKQSGKTFHFFEGYCPVHERMGLDELKAAKAAMPDAPLLVHPECRSELQDFADAVLSTSQMTRYAKTSPATRFLVATEREMLYRLAKDCPGKEFFPAGPERVCVNMKKTGLEDLRDSLRDMKHEVSLDEATISAALASLEAMVRIS